MRRVAPTLPTLIHPLPTLRRATPASSRGRLRRNNSKIFSKGQEEYHRYPHETRQRPKDELLERISVDPKVCFGKPCIRGHRIWVSLILDLLASGWSFREIVDNYPGLEEADIRACIAYGAEMSRERYVDIHFAESA